MRRSKSMKAKHWIVVGVVAVLCVGAAVLLSNKTSTEGVPVASSVPIATEEPAQAAESAEDVVFNAEKPEDIKAEEPADTTEVHYNIDYADDDRICAPENLTEEDLEYLRHAKEKLYEDFEYNVNYNMNKWGMTREEAEQAERESIESAAKHDLAAKKRRAELTRQREVEAEARRQIQYKEFKERTGWDYDEFGKLGYEKMCEVMREHPEIEWGLKPVGGN